MLVNAFENVCVHNVVDGSQRGSRDQGIQIGVTMLTYGI